MSNPEVYCESSLMRIRSLREILDQWEGEAISIDPKNSRLSRHDEARLNAEISKYVVRVYPYVHDGVIQVIEANAEGS